MKNSLRWCVIPVGAICLGVVSCTAATAESDKSVTSQVAALQPGTVKLKPESRQYLEIEPVTATAGGATVRAPGRVAFRDGGVAEVGTPIEGRVMTIHVKVGDTVKRGDPLVTVQSPAALAARGELASSELAHRAALASLQRQVSMASKGVGIESEKFQAEIDSAKTEAELARAKHAAAYLGEGSGASVVIRAPMDGTVLERKTSIGAVADPSGEALIEIGDTTALWVVADVFERDLPRVTRGAAVELELASLSTPVKGHVASLGSVVTSGLRAAPVYVTLDAPGLTLRPGMFARASIAADANQGVSVPVTAVLIKDGKKSVVYVEQETNTFIQREVSVGQPVDGRVQVVSGLNAGENVVLKGALLLDASGEQLL